jgi:hypothetical protein
VSAIRPAFWFEIRIFPEAVALRACSIRCPSALMASAKVERAQKAASAIFSYYGKQIPLLALWKAHSSASSTASALA